MAYSLCYFGNHPEHPPNCRPLLSLEGGIVHVIVNSFKSCTIGIFEAWVQLSSEYPNPHKHLGHKSVVYMWTSPHSASFCFAERLCQLKDRDNFFDTTPLKVTELSDSDSAIDAEGGDVVNYYNQFVANEPHLLANQCDKVVLLSYWALSLQAALNPLAPIVYQCLSQHLISSEIFSASGGGGGVSSCMYCDRVISGGMITVDELKTTVLENQSDDLLKFDLVSSCFGESATLTSVFLGVFDMLYSLCSPSAPSLSAHQHHEGQVADSKSSELYQAEDAVQLNNNENNKNKHQNRPALVVLLGGGLTNRRRVLVSAMTLSRLSHRRLVLLWPLDAHCLCSFHDLFDSQQEQRNDQKIEVYEFKLFSPPEIIDTLFSHAAVVNDMVKTYVYIAAGGRKMELNNESHVNKHVYVRSYYWFNADVGNTQYNIGNTGSVKNEINDEVNKQLELIRLSETVEEEVKLELDKIKQTMQTALQQSTFSSSSSGKDQHDNGSSYISVELVMVHMRAQTNISVDVPLASPHAEVELVHIGDSVEPKRRSCSGANMLAAMRKIINSNTPSPSPLSSSGGGGDNPINKVVLFYVASDVESEIRWLQERIPNVLSYSGRLCRDMGGPSLQHVSRGKECMQRALVEQSVLIRAESVSQMLYIHIYISLFKCDILGCRFSPHTHTHTLGSNNSAFQSKHNIIACFHGKHTGYFPQIALLFVF
jgi:hypothetical protein